MRWTDLAFLHWPVAGAALRPLLPRGLELDLYEGEAWLGVVPFRMEGVRCRWLPPIPTAANFLEVNVRTYVIGGSRPGVWFFSLDAQSRLAVRGARLALNLPYHHARMRAGRHSNSVAYESRRAAPRHVSAAFEASYTPVGSVYRSDHGSLDHWLSERYCLFGQNRSGRIYYVNVHHLPWPLQRARAIIEQNTLTTLLDSGAARNPAVCHFAERLDVIAWAPAWLD